MCVCVCVCVYVCVITIQPDLSFKILNSFQPVCFKIVYQTRYRSPVSSNINWLFCISYDLCPMFPCPTLLVAHSEELSSFAIFSRTFRTKFFKDFSYKVMCVIVAFSCWWISVRNFKLISNFDNGQLSGNGLSLYHYAAPIKQRLQLTLSFADLTLFIWKVR